MARRGECGADAARWALATDRSPSAVLRATTLTLLPLPPTQPADQAVGATQLDPGPLMRATVLRACWPRRMAVAS